MPQRSAAPGVMACRDRSVVAGVRPPAKGRSAGSRREPPGSKATPSDAEAWHSDAVRAPGCCNALRCVATCHRTVLHDVASWPSALQHGRAGSRERVGSCACECAYDVVRYGDAVHPAQPRLVPKRPCATAAVRRQWQRLMPLPAASMHVVALVIHRMPCVGGLGVGYECVARPAFCS